MKLGIIIVTYKTKRHDLEGLLKSLRPLGSLMHHQPIIIDNSRTNLGFGKAVNIGLKKALVNKNDLFLLLNPDLKIANLNYQLITKTARYFDIFGGCFKQSGFTYYGGVIDYWSLSGGLISQKPAFTYQPVDFVSGSMMFIKKKVIEKIGFFNEQFFLYYEDVDYCYRARQNSLRVGINPKISYAHFENSQFNPQKKHYLENSHQLFVKLWANLPQKLYHYFYLPVKQKLCA